MLTNEKKIAFIADTPFQIMNCIILLENIDSLLGISADIFVGNQFIDSAKVVDNLRSFSKFKNIYNYYPNRVKKTSFRSRIMEISNPKWVMDEMLDKESKYIIDNEKYNEIYLSILTKFSVAFIYLNSEAKIVYFDDGLGNYLGNTWQKPLSFSHKIMYWLLGKNPNHLKVRYRYVTNLNLWIHTAGKREKVWVKEIEGIKSIITVDCLSNIFQYSSNNELNNSIVLYLTQPITQKRINNFLIERELLNKLHNYKLMHFIRKHPRDAEDYDVNDVCNCKNMWELFCLKDLQESVILIGMFSTALVMPKLMFDKEPRIIFTYKLFEKIFKKDAANNIAEIIYILKKSYKESERIMVPESIQEFEENISSLLNERNK